MSDIKSGRCDVRLIRDIRIPTADAAVTLSADLYRPAVPGPVPALVTVLPYRKDTQMIAGDASPYRWFAEQGYATLLVDFRGTGASDGMQRPPFDPGEADDAIAAIEWVAGEPWCNGNVGMSGGSYGALMALRTASRSPSQLKAIVAAEGMLDPERDMVHPCGTRGGLGLAIWGAGTLANQLLPPLYNAHSGAEQRRWRMRLHDTEPYIVDLVRHGPNDEVWRSRAIDPSLISVPTLCVGGWRDLFCDATVRAYEQIEAPKKLVMGPWMHESAHAAQIEAIDYYALELRWWNHWLRGLDTGLMDEAPIALYLQGDRPGWRAYDHWPPAKENLVLVAGGHDGSLALHAKTERGTGRVVGAFEPDPTSGALSAMWRLSTSGVGVLPDQHDDDGRGLAATSSPLDEDVLICGRPQVTVRLGQPCPTLTEGRQRLVVRLTDVAADGRSSFITSGLAQLMHPSAKVDPSGEVRVGVALWPTAYRVAAGHRLRVVVTEGDFPRLWPSAGAADIQVAGIELVAPTASGASDVAIALAAREDRTSERNSHVPPTTSISRRVTRDLVDDSVELALEDRTAVRMPADNHWYEANHKSRAVVGRHEPEAAVLESTDSRTVRMSTGSTIEVKTRVRLTQATLWAAGEVTIDGLAVFSRTWEVGYGASFLSETDEALP